ncbi:MAG: LysR family transcriptional regulator, partial [Streptomyces sp.]|nr:LysR family transcriptional regulator [Streptomyces sp.]
MLDLQRLRALHAVSVHGTVGAAATPPSHSPPGDAQRLDGRERHRRRGRR